MCTVQSKISRSHFFYVPVLLLNLGVLSSLRAGDFMNYFDHGFPAPELAQGDTPEQAEFLLNINLGNTNTVRRQLKISPELARCQDPDTGVSALSAASAQQDPALANLLLLHKADVNSPSHKGDTPLHRALSRENLKTAELLLTHGARKTTQNCAGETPLALAEKNNLIEHGALAPFFSALRKSSSRSQLAASP